MAKDDMNRRRNLGFFFDQSAARRPDKVAIIDLFGGRERCATYRQLDERMNGVASMLARLGVVPGERGKYALTQEGTAALSRWPQPQA